MTVKKDLFVCSFSGGKDSTALLLRMLESGMPVNIILFNETGLDFPEMEAHIEKVEQYIKKYTDIGITRIKPEKPFEYFRTRNTSSKKFCVQREIRCNA